MAEQIAGDGIGFGGPTFDGPTWDVEGGVTVIDKPGLEYALPARRLHYAEQSRVLEYDAEPSRVLEYAMEAE